MDQKKEIPEIELEARIRARRAIEAIMKWKRSRLEEVSQALDRMIAGKVQRITIFKSGPVQEK